MSIQHLVLAVDDQPATLRVIRSELSEQGFRVMTVSTGSEAIELAEAYRPDLVLMDTKIPGTLSGMDVLRRIRDRWAMPVILTSSNNNTLERVRGLEAGADDFIVKPMSPEELGARIRAVLRRCSSTTAERIVRPGDLEIDILRRRVTRGSTDVTLSRTEWLLLEHLAANAGKVMFNHSPACRGATKVESVSSLIGLGRLWPPSRKQRRH
jgi:two-component system KDP operon response regulator KdpE